MSAYRGKLVLLPPHRVWRTYTGGRTLDALTGVARPADGHFPEDWIASTTRARNGGREHVREGVSPVLVGGAMRDFDELLASDPEYFLGSAHAARFGPQPMLLVKLLDPAIRLHFQVHPTAEFARQFLGTPSGKTEAYHVLSTRPLHRLRRRRNTPPEPVRQVLLSSGPRRADVPAGSGRVAA